MTVVEAISQNTDSQSFSTSGPTMKYINKTTRGRRMSSQKEQSGSGCGGARKRVGEMECKPQRDVSIKESAVLRICGQEVRPLLTGLL